MQAPDEKDLRTEFLDRVAVRLEKGATDYGNANLELPTPGTAEEILDEVLDLAGWAYVLWVQMRRRLQGLEIAAQGLAGEEVPNGQARPTSVSDATMRPLIRHGIYEHYREPPGRSFDDTVNLSAGDDLADPDPEC